MPHAEPTVTSIHNPFVKRARSLHRRHVRYEERVFLVEGIRLVADALESGARAEIIFYDVDSDDARLAALVDSAAAAGARVVATTATVIRTVADTETPQGVIAIFPFPDLDVAAPRGVAPLLLIVDGVRDPGNLGTLVRSALGAGAHAIFVTRETVDPFSPKVARAGMGAHFRMPIRRLDWGSPEPIVGGCSQRLGATVAAETAYDLVDWTQGSSVIVGNETTGLSDAAKRFMTGSVSIPLAGGLESLNVGIAGSVILFEAARQRRARNLR